MRKMIKKVRWIDGKQQQHNVLEHIVAAALNGAGVINPVIVRGEGGGGVD